MQSDIDARYVIISRMTTYFAIAFNVTSFPNIRVTTHARTHSNVLICNYLTHPDILV